MFVGRQHELDKLETLYAQGGFQMVVLYGRRRVGKTALTMRFSQGKPTLAFTAKVQNDALNLADFSRQVYKHFGLPLGTGTFPSWEDALAFVARQAGDQHLVFVFDEFPYAAQHNASLVSTFQIACDRFFSSTNVFLILTGSNQGFMEEKVLGTADSGERLGQKDPLFGRRTAQIHLAPFGYRNAALMLPDVGSEDLVRYYATFGGTPYYLSMVDPRDNYATNVERLFFRKEGLLYEEPIMLLRQELREPAVYSSILDAIAAGANKPQEIANRIGEKRTSLAKYLRTLVSMHLVEKRVPLGEDLSRSRRGIYRICEPAFAFWYRFVQPEVASVEMDAGELVARELLQSDDIPTYVGYWFEDICLQWVVWQAKHGALPLRPVRFGSWWGTDPSAREQTDIDVVASSDRRSELLVGECKWRRKFDEARAAQNLVHRAGLLGDYDSTTYCLFSRNPVDAGLRDGLGAGWLFVDADDLYR